MAGSIREIRRMMGGPSPAYEKIRQLVKGRDWEIVAFTAEWVVVRVDRENIKFDRYRGTIKEKVKF